MENVSKGKMKTPLENQDLGLEKIAARIWK